MHSKNLDSMNTEEKADTKDSAAPLAVQSRRLFGTDGIRGIANQYPMTCETALSLGRAVAHLSHSGNHRHRIVIGKDTRLSGYMIEMAFASGVCSMGVDAILVGPLPTPAIAFITHNMRADAGVVISASHNPFEDNGIKIFGRDGFKLPDQMEANLEGWMTDEEIGNIRPTKDAVGKAFRVDDALGRYVVHLKSAFPNNLDLCGLSVVVDCAHGAAYKVAPMVLRELGAEVHAIGISPNGRNINAGCGALFPDKLAEVVLARGADIGIALDGDADRLVVVDHTGEVLHGDTLLYIAALEQLEQKRLLTKTVVTTVMANLALDNALKSRGVTCLRTQVGDRYVVEEMRRGGHTLGGENSGHLVHLDHSTTGDGMLAALQLLSIMKRKSVTLSSLAAGFELFPQVQHAVKVARKPQLETVPAIFKVIEDAKSRLGDKGRVLVRYSGTEPKVRVLVESEDASLASELAEQIAGVLQEQLSDD